MAMLEVLDICYFLNFQDGMFQADSCKNSAEPGHGCNFCTSTICFASSLLYTVVCNAQPVLDRGERHA